MALTLTAERAMLAPIAVYAWQVLGAGATFTAVERGRSYGLAWLITLGW